MDNKFYEEPYLDTNLSQRLAETRHVDDLTNIDNDVFENTSDNNTVNTVLFTEIPSAIELPHCNKVMAFEESTTRPRSFSDASISSGRRPGILKKIQHRIQASDQLKTSMKVLVKRESKAISDAAADAEFGFVTNEGYVYDQGLPTRHSTGYSSLDNLLDDSPESRDAPAKPALPQEYRQYLSKQLKLFKEHQRNCSKTVEFDIVNLEQRSQNDKISKYEHELKSTTTDFVNIDSSREGAKVSPDKPQLRRGRSSVSDLRSSSMVYKHLDPQFRTEMLRKELERLRQKRHVRKNSETMKQRFESILRHKSTGDVHVRFADEVDDDNDDVIDKTGGDYEPPPKPPLRQTNSLDLYTSRDWHSKQIEPTHQYARNYGSITNKDGHNQPTNTIDLHKGRERHSQSNTSSGDYKHRPESSGSMTQKVSKPSGPGAMGYDVNYRERAATMATSRPPNHESRSQVSNRGQGGQGRSRSATGLDRVQASYSDKAEWRPLAGTQGSQVSKSASNLRRKQDTIRKFNLRSMEQKREHVRENFIKNRQNRVESMSPDDSSINLERELAVAQERLFLQRLGSNKEGKVAVGDNRSDEEKCAALSGTTIIHSKSSSLDSQGVSNGGYIQTENENRVGEKNIGRPSAEQNRRGGSMDGNDGRIGAQRSKQTAYVKPHVHTNVLNKPSVSIDGAQSSSSSDTAFTGFKGQIHPDLIKSSNRKLTKGASLNNSTHFNDVPKDFIYPQDKTLQKSHGNYAKSRNTKDDTRKHSLTSAYVPTNYQREQAPELPKKQGAEQSRRSVISIEQGGVKVAAGHALSGTGNSYDTRQFRQGHEQKREAAAFDNVDKATVGIEHKTKCSGSSDHRKLSASQSVPVAGSGGGQDGQGGTVVLRQCRVGGDVVFGLVQVAPPTTTAAASTASKQEGQTNGPGYVDGQGLVTIRMIPDDQGRFGFNVKGGADQGMPIIVSRVAPNTPADNAIPRLNEGDQVLFINGRDVSQHTHEQVVIFIRQSRETRTKELNLVVRPNAYTSDDALEENDDHGGFSFDVESFAITTGGGVNALNNSLTLLEESLESNAAIAQFEQLYRKKPGMTMNIARLEANVPKNRYRDISPYDQTRVMIKSGLNGDYINANYVNMEIPVSGILNRYIAAQGPLPTTCVDFWQMVWEQQSSLVVMLTTEVERGRIKCHQYWPNLYETTDYRHLQITCVKEEKSASFAFREFNLTNIETEEERHISHMQYIAWPDHGVPDDPADFLEFVMKVRLKRVGIVEPIIVHCSAGIGRTGVLITMETAMCLIEANQPVIPLSIVRQMRDQRAMLIQTPNQYKFVCEAIIKCYNEGIVKPLPEYQQR